MNSSSRFRRSILNYIAHSFKFIVTVLLGFVITPLIVRWTGQEGYGAYKLIESWSSFLGLFEFGLFNGLLTLMAQSLGEQDHDRLKNIITTGFQTYLKITILIFVLTIISTFLIPFFITTKAYSDLHLQISYFLVSCTFLFVASTPFRAFLESAQRGDLVNHAILAQLVTTSFLSLLFSSMGMGVLGLSLALFIGAIVVHSCFVLYAFKRLPFRLAWKDIGQGSSEIRTKIYQLGKENFLISLAQKLSFTADSIIVGMAFSAEMVAPFFLTQRLPQLAMQQIQSITHATWASIIDLYHSGDNEKFKHRFMDTFKFLMMAGGAILVPIAVYNKEFIFLWVGRTNFVSQNFTLVCCLMGFFVGIDFFFSSLLKAVGVVKEQIGAEFGGGLVNIILSIALVSYMGLEGPILATFLVTTLVIIFFKLPLIEKKFEISKLAFGIELLKLLAWLSLWYYTSMAIKEYLNLILNWPLLIISMGVNTLIYGVTSWFVMIRKQERKFWQDKIINIFKK